MAAMKAGPSRVSCATGAREAPRSGDLLDEVDGLELAGPVRWGTTPSLQGPASLPVRIRRQ